MPQRDFIMRLIEQLGTVLAELRRRVLQQADPTGVRDDLARAAAQAGFDIEMLRGFDIPTLHLLVAPAGGDVDITRCWLMAEILYIDGIEAELSGGDGRESLWKARALYDLVRPAGGMLVGMPEAQERIAEIDERFDARDPSPEAP
jgi:hypothetical protein